jgi:ribosomal protein S24E
MLKALIFPILLIFHPVHVTLTSIDQAQGSDSLKVFFRMYYDDFLLDYKLYDPQFDFEKISGDQSIPADLVNKYFNDKVQIYVNHKLLKGKLLTVNILDNYEICLNLLYRSDKEPQRIKIRNQVLTGLYSDQENMIFFSINKYEDAMRLTPEHYKEIRRLKIIDARIGI